VRTAVITSCSASGFVKQGLRCLATLHQFWPADIDVYLVSEDNLVVPADILQGRRFKFLSLSDSQNARDFYTQHAASPRVKGVTNAYYDFRFDAWKFSKKVFAIEMVAAQVDVQRLLWLDADVFTYAQVPDDLFNLLPPHALAVAHLARPGYHSECGFVGYNLSHVATRPFIKAFAATYSNGTVFKLKEWHDSFVFDHLLKRLAVPSYKIPHKSRSHPFVHSVLGKYMDHLKGVQRKEQGKSYDHPRNGGVARVLSNRKPRMESWVERRNRIQQKRKQVKVKDAAGAGDLAAGRGHPLPGDAQEVADARWQGDVPVGEAADGTSVDPSRPATLGN
jgi:hypothetical protein